MANHIACLLTVVNGEKGTRWNLPVKASKTFPSTHLIPDWAADTMRMEYETLTPLPSSCLLAFALPCGRGL